MKKIPAITPLCDRGFADRDEWTAHLTAWTKESLNSSVIRLEACDLIKFADFIESDNATDKLAITVFAKRFIHSDTKAEWHKNMRECLRKSFYSLPDEARKKIIDPPQ